MRRVGLEVEYGGIGVGETVPVLVDVLGGRVVRQSATEATVDVPRWGEFRVEIDSVLLKDQRILQFFGLSDEGHDGTSAFVESIESAILRIASGIVPHEIITPPIPWNELHLLDPLWKVLPEQGARGTHESILYAFGLHLNVEVPDLEVTTLLSFLRSFLLLEEWIREQSKIDWTRRAVLPYVDPFPESYRRKLLNPGYVPSMHSFIDDYLEENPTRNRALDMLPIIATIEPDAVKGRVEQEHLVRARPAFHYRLPNCELGRPEWSPADEWNRWVHVEELAGSEPKQLREVSQRFLAANDDTTPVWVDARHEELN